MDLTDLLAGILSESGYEDMLRASGEEERLDNLAELKQAIYDFAGKAGEEVTLGNYLDHAALFTNMDQREKAQAVKLMTIHAAKGLEFNTVFVVGLEENIFPSLMSVDNIKDLEEERRLLYVAITRAEKHCYLTWAHTRWRYGKLDAFVNPSRFISEINPKYLRTEVEGGRSAGSFSSWGGNSSARTSWGSSRDDDYEINKPYTGFSDWGDGY